MHVLYDRFNQDFTLFTYDDLMYMYLYYSSLVTYIVELLLVV